MKRVDDSMTLSHNQLLKNGFIVVKMIFFLAFNLKKMEKMVNAPNLRKKIQSM